MNYTQDDFFNVPRVERQTSEGEVQFPILYFDSSAIFFYYFVPANIINEKLEGTGLKVFRTITGHGIIGIAFYDYRDTSIGSYKEMGLASVVYPRNKKQVCVVQEFISKQSRDRITGLYIHNLPVTTKAANVAGRETWGYPKFLTDIDFSLDKFLMLRNFEGAVKNPDSNQNIFSISSTSGTGIQVPGYDLNIYSNLNSKILQTNVDVGNTLFSCPINRTKIKVESPEHPMGKNIIDLGLDKLNPVMVQYTFNLKTRLHLGVEI